MVSLLSRSVKRRGGARWHGTTIGVLVNGAGERDVAGLRAWLRERVGDVAGVAVSEIAGDVPLREYGMSSRDAVMVAGELEDLLDTEVSATLLWEHPTIDEIAERLAATADAGGEVDPAAGDGRTAGAEPVAVVGLGCRLPGADGPEQFWELLRTGRDAIGRVPEGRWEQFTAGSAVDDAALARTPRHGGFLPDVSGFDAEFFGITPREAALMDPQQRMLLETSWEALEHAGIAPESLRGSATGVFVGLASQDYSLLTMSDLTAVDVWSSTGVSPSIAGNRISYMFDLRGPSVTLDTACSSSLVAVHQACQALRTGEVDNALVGGVNLLLSPATMLNFELGGALAADGRCKAFDAAADGIARGEGCGMVVLKRLDDARRDGDRVLAVLRGSAVNSDGRSNGLTAPNPAAQQELLHTAYRMSETAPGDVDYVEAHGTGTLLGDPIEASALGTVLGHGRQRDRPLLLGSVKTNLGHLEAAAGIAGLIKVVLAMAHDEIPPGLHFHSPNPHIPFEDSALRVLTEPEPWPRYGGVARAGVSGFGFGGTNAHVVVEEYVADHPAGTGRREHEHRSAWSGTDGRAPADVVVLSGRSQPRLREAANSLASWLDAPQGRAADTRFVAATLARRRSHDPHRAAVLARDNEELAAALRALASGSSAPEVCTGSARADRPGPVWVFSGYGSQWPGMGAGLLAEEPAFAQRVDELDAYFPDHAGFSLRKVLETGERVDELERAQLVIFGVQLGLAALWHSLGVEPAAVIGHSMGEVAAAVVAGGIGTEDGVRVMATRARLLAGLNDLGGGAMAAVELSVAELTDLREDYPQVDVAVYGAPDQLTVAGDAEQLRALVRHVEGLGRTARLLPVRGAGHSAAVDPVVDELRGSLADVAATAVTVPRYTSVLDDPRATAASDADYWVANARRPVRFTQAVAAALEDGYTNFLEISPHPIASGAIVRTAQHHGAATPLVAASLRRGHDEAWTVRANLGRLYCAGAAIRWEAVYPGHELVDLPRTRWQHQPHWFRSARAPAAAIAAAAQGHSREAAGRETADHIGPSEHGSVSAGAYGERIRRAGPEAARGMLADHVRAVVADVMGFAPDGLDARTPLLELGLDSLMTMRIKHVVEHDLGIGEVTPTALRGATLDDVTDYLAEVLGLAGQAPEEASNGEPDTGSGDATRSPHTEPATPDEDGPLRVLRGGGTRPPLFVFHAAGGACDVYRPLVDALDAQVPVYGFDRIDDPDLSGRVATYLERLRTVQPHGPYRLAGWSFGGALAYQAACELTATGESVELVALIDTVLPLPDPHADPRVSTAHRFLRFGRYVAQTYGCDLRLRLDELAELSSERQIELVMARAAEAGLDTSPGALRHQRDSFADTLAAERHRPRPYPGPVVLYRAEQPDTTGATLEPRYNRADPAAGWDDFCDRLEVVPVPGNHLSVIDQPHVRAIAEHLGGALDGRVPGDAAFAEAPGR